ncbi:MAG: hypothetical protein IIC78_12575 [Chloroflexi bacterium]|nr:hypothetical protein [Chloroflexota bacterium]
MSIGSTAERLTTKGLENWLTESLVLVEPNAKFVKRLKAKLIRYHGNRPFSGWVVLGTFAMALMLLLTLLGLALRFILLIFSLIGVIERKRKSRDRSRIPLVGN